MGGRYELTAFLQASRGGGGRWLQRKKPGARSTYPKVLASAARKHGDHNASAPSTYCRQPLPQDSTISPGSRGAGSPTPPPPPRSAPLSLLRPGPAQPPALTAPTAPAAPPLPRLLPNPLPALAAPPDPSRAGPGGSEHVGPLRPEPEAALRPASSPRWGLSRLLGGLLVSLCP